MAGRVIDSWSWFEILAVTEESSFEIPIDGECDSVDEDIDSFLSLQASSSICVFCALLPVIMANPHNRHGTLVDESWLQAMLSDDIPVMVNPHNRHDTLVDESWLQAMLSDDNTELPYDIIESWPQTMLSDDNTELPSDIIESWPQAMLSDEIPVIMVNPHNRHGTLVDESWLQAMLSDDNTELPSDIIESWPQAMLSDDNTELPSDIIESWPQAMLSDEIPVIMVNPHNRHDTLVDESWLQAMLSDDNTELPSDIIESWPQAMPSDDNTQLPSDIIESWPQAMLSDDNTGLPSDIIATTTDERGIESHCRRSGHTEKFPWSVEEVLKLIVGVSSIPSETGRKRWQEIVKKYFKGERTEEKLKQKWKDLKKHATKKTDGEQWLFYMMAAIVEVAIQSKKTGVFNNVIKEWCVAWERSAEATKAYHWLISVTNMEPEKQLNKIKEYVTDAEQNHAYAKIPYWSSQVHP
ncbi:unnamed protein product [Camellia sinensis]